MSDERDVSLGEVYRLCERIEKKVDLTNGRVTALENDVVRIKAFWTAGTFGAAALWPYVKGKLGL
jgi:hypothetical protein